MKKNYKKLICAVMVLCVMFSFSGCTTYNNFKAAFFPSDKITQEQTIKIGIYEPLSGPNADQGKEEVKGIELAHELYGTVLGKKVELVYEDNQSDMYVAETAIQELLSQNPAVILGSYGETLSLVASDYIKASNTPAITISGSNPLITSNNEYYFTATFSETRQGDALADFAYKKQKVSKVAVVKFLNDDAATQITKRFTNRMKKLTGKDSCIAGRFNIETGTTDFTELIGKIQDSGAKAVFLELPAETAQLIMEKAISMEVTDILWLGDRSWDNEAFLKFVESQELLKVAYTTDFGDEPATSMSHEFLEAYQAKYGADAVPTAAVAVGFDAYLLALQGIEEAMDLVMNTTMEDLEEKYDTDVALKVAKEELLAAQESGMPSGRQIKIALTAIEDFVGASGIISYGNTNEASKDLVIKYIEMAPEDEEAEEGKDAESAEGADDAEKPEESEESKDTDKTDKKDESADKEEKKDESKSESND